MERKIWKLNDEFIIQLTRLIQLAMLTGTNVVDHMRLMRVEQSASNADTVVLTPEYLEYFEENIEKMIEQANTLQEQPPAN